jgi:hypothetical protein
MITNRIKKSYDFLWLGIALFFVLTISFLLSLMPNDYWWYLRVGHETLQAGRVPTVDTYSFTRAGSEVVYSDWLASVVLWVTYKVGGVTLTIFLRGLMMAGTFGLLWGAMRRLSGPKLATLLTIFVMLASSRNWPPVRPQMFAFPLFICVLLVLQDWQNGGKKNIWWLPFISILWANLHGSFVLVYVLGFAALVFGKGNRKNLALALALSILAAMVNPEGAGIWTTLKDAKNISNISVEWLPPSNDDWHMNLFFGWLLLFPVLAVFSTRKLSLLDWVWFLALGWLALSGMRFVIWFQLLLALQTAELLSEWDKRWLDRGAGAQIPALNLVLGGVLLLMPIGVLPGIREQWWRQSPPALSENTPVAAVEWLAAHPDLPNPMWNDFGFSSYLIFALPSRPVWIDVRMHQAGYTTAQYERYSAIHSAHPGWQEMLDEEGINLLMLDTQEEHYLVEALETSPTWCLQHTDDISAIYLRLKTGETCPTLKTKP